MHKIINQMIVRREHSTYELRSCLRMKGYHSEEIDALLSGYEEKGYVCNKRYAQEKIRGLMARGYGPIYVRQLLKQHHIEIDASEHDWADSYRVAIRRAQGKSGVKLKAFLFRRGFNQEMSDD